MSCLGCNKRTVIPNCHSTCADYINYKESIERDKQRILKERIKKYNEIQFNLLDGNVWKVKKYEQRVLQKEK